MKRDYLEVTYKCTNSKCGHTQVVRYFPDDAPLPATCCVACRSGFGNDMSYGAMAANGIGMRPIARAHA